MRILKKTSQLRRDFDAILVCEHCSHQQKLINAYDDEYYHKNAIPAIKCEKCGLVASEDYTPNMPKYGADETI